MINKGDTKMKNPFTEHLQNFSMKYKDKITKTCAPLVEHFNISHFSYVKVTNEGHFCTISNHPSWVEYYFSQDLFIDQPHFCHPRNFCSGMMIPALIDDDNYQHIAQKGRQQFNVNPGVVIVKKSVQAVELYGFDIKSENSAFINLLINESALLHKFINHFEKQNHTMMTQVSQNPVCLAPLLGKTFFRNDDSLMKRHKNKENFLKHIGVDAPTALSSREKEILKYMIDGLSASAIAAMIHLSPRTVEHYVINIKNKLDCFSKAELIQKGNEFNLLGLLE
jgi:DNA-binding CsgD family transcriptional regulator